MEQTDKKKSRDFNIYYLNFSKVYEIAMMINNVILTKIETDNSIRVCTAAGLDGVYWHNYVLR